MGTFYTIIGILCAGVCLGIFPLFTRKEKIFLSINIVFSFGLVAYGLGFL